MHSSIFWVTAGSVWIVAAWSNDRAALYVDSCGEARAARFLRGLRNASLAAAALNFGAAFWESTP